MGLSDKEWRDLEKLIVASVFGLCLTGFLLTTSWIKDTRAEAASNLSSAVSSRTKQIDSIVLELKEYQKENSKDHYNIMMIQERIAAKLGVITGDNRSSILGD